MKVLLVTNQYVDIREDGCYSDSALCGTLENMCELGEIHVVAGKLTPDKPSSLPLVCKLDFLNPGNVDYFRPLNRTIGSYLKNKKYNRHLLERLIPDMDLVIGYVPNGNADVALSIAQKNGVPFMSFLVGCPWDAMHNHHRLLARIMAPFCFLSTRKTVKDSDYVHYVTMEFLQKRYPTNGKSLGCSDTNLRKLDDRVLQKRLQKVENRKESDEIRLATTANTDVRYKGHEFVIKAIAQLRKQGDSRYHYDLIGGGTGERLRKLCKELGVESNVHFLGRKKWDEVIAILTDTDVYVQASLQEGLPRSVVEAMSTALPCIGFNTGGIPELLEEEFVVQRKDVKGIVGCLVKLQDKALYIKTAERSFRTAKEYEHDTLVARIKEFFKEIRLEIENK